MSRSISLTSVDVFNAPAETRARVYGKWAITIPQRNLPIRAPIATAIGRGTRIKGMGMTEQPNNAASEREEIVARVARFKATQERFKREREEYFVTTLENARRSENTRHSHQQPPFWS